MHNEITIEFDQLTLTIQVDRLISDAPQPDCRDSADTARGERSVDYRVVYGVEYDDQGRVDQCGQLPWWLNKLARDNHVAIEAGIWAAYDRKAEAQAECQ